MVFHPAHKPDSSLRPDENHRDFVQNDTFRVCFKFLLLVLFSQAFLNAQPDAILHIQILQDSRVVHSEELLSFLNSSSPEVHRQALLAFANIQDPTVLNEITLSLDDTSSKVR